MTVSTLKSRVNDIEKLKDGFSTIANTCRENPENLKKVAEVCGFKNTRDLEVMLDSGYIFNMLIQAYNDAIDKAEVKCVSIE